MAILTSPSAAKAATMITDRDIPRRRLDGRRVHVESHEQALAGLLGTAGQVLSVAILVTAGIAAAR